MKDPSSNCSAVIKRAEALRLVAYLCPSGIPTIGWGHTNGVRLGERCSKEQAEAWLKDDMGEAVRRVGRYVKAELNQGQFDALVSFAFNTREEQFRTSTLVRLVNAGSSAAADQFERWIYGRGKDGKPIRLAGLEQRREAEAALFRGEADFMRHFL